jgi:hypothetical protein
MLEQMSKSWKIAPAAPFETSYPELVGRGLKDPPASYPWANEEQRKQATIETGYLLGLIDSYGKGEKVFRDGAPEPEPQLRIMPHW